MPSLEQLVANLANAQRSTGPRTEEGKAASSLNALSHGLTAKTVVLPDEDPAEFEALQNAVLREFAPSNSTLRALATELAGLQWRLLRLPRLEAKVLSADAPDLKFLHNLSLHAARLKRQYSATLKELLRLRDLFARERQEQLHKAATVHFADFLRKRPTTVGQFGFDFTIPEIEAYVDQQNALNSARLTLIKSHAGWTA